jgi:hypothetical protein
MDERKLDGLGLVQPREVGCGGLSGAGRRQEERESRERGDRG